MKKNIGMFILLLGLTESVFVSVVAAAAAETADLTSQPKPMLSEEDQLKVLTKEAEKKYGEGYFSDKHTEQERRDQFLQLEVPDSESIEIGRIYSDCKGIPDELVEKEGYVFLSKDLSVQEILNLVANLEEKYCVNIRGGGPQNDFEVLWDGIINKIIIGSPYEWVLSTYFIQSSVVTAEWLQREYRNIIQEQFKRSKKEAEASKPENFYIHTSPSQYQQRLDQLLEEPLREDILIPDIKTTCEPLPQGLIVKSENGTTSIYLSGALSVGQALNLMAQLELNGCLPKKSEASLFNESVDFVAKKIIENVFYRSRFKRKYYITGERICFDSGDLLGLYQKVKEGLEEKLQAVVAASKSPILPPAIQPISPVEPSALDSKALARQAALQKLQEEEVTLRKKFLAEQEELQKQFESEIATAKTAEKKRNLAKEAEIEKQKLVAQAARELEKVLESKPLPSQSFVPITSAQSKGSMSQIDPQFAAQVADQGMNLAEKLIDKGISLVTQENLQQLFENLKLNPSFLEEGGAAVYDHALRNPVDMAYLKGYVQSCIWLLEKRKQLAVTIKGDSVKIVQNMIEVLKIAKAGVSA